VTPSNIQNEGVKRRKYDWKTNDAEGRRLRRAFKRLAKRLETATTAQEIIDMARALAYIAQAKSTLAKHDFDREIEARIEELERIAGLAHKGRISQ
jgi:hypothetical protein